MATGIVVRTIAPFIQHKMLDPAVVVLDEMGTYAISLLSGHLGGANEVTNRVAKLVGATAVITTASDLHGKMAIDMFAKNNGLIIDNLTHAKEVTALLLNGKCIDQRNETLLHLPTVYDHDNEADAVVLVTHRKDIQPLKPTVKLIPKNLVLGIGCRRDTSSTAIIEFIRQQLTELNIDCRALLKIASVDVKSNEPGILKTALRLKLPVVFINRDEIKTVESHFCGSSFVKQTIGVSAVCEPVAFLAGGSKGRFLLHKTASNGITLAIFEKDGLGGEMIYE